MQKKNILTRIHQKSADLRRIVQTALDRTNKKRILQEKQLKDTTEKRKVPAFTAELINTYGYNLKPDCRSFEALNYYTNEMTDRSSGSYPDFRPKMRRSIFDRL